jgi:hypothetical protein
MAELENLAFKGKDALAALERLAESQIARIVIGFFLFCDCYMFVARGRSVLTFEWSVEKTVPVGSVLLCIAAYSFAMTVVAYFWLSCTEFGWKVIGSLLQHLNELLEQLLERLFQKFGLFSRDNQEAQQASEEPGSAFVKRLQRGFVSKRRLFERSLRGQNGFLLRWVEQCHKENVSSNSDEFRGAYSSSMMILLTLIDIGLGWKGHNTALWTIGGKLEPHPLVLLLVVGAYGFLAINPLREFFQSEDSQSGFVFYPPLADELLEEIRQKNGKQEQQGGVWKAGWGSARPLELMYIHPSANANAAMQIAERQRALVRYLGHCDLHPRATVARIAESLGYDSPATLDAVLRGDRPLSFPEAHQMCETFGVSSSWLLDGEPSPFSQRAIYSRPGEFLRALVLHNLTWGDHKQYYRLLFLLPPGDSDHALSASVFGQRDETLYRVDELLSGVPIFAETGSRFGLFDFCLAAAAICAPMHLSYSGLNQVSYIARKDEQYLQILRGEVHLSYCRSELNHSHWLEDVWDLEYVRGQDHYTQAFRDSYQDFSLQAKKLGIINNEALFQHLKREIAEIRRIGHDACPLV